MFGAALLRRRTRLAIITLVVLCLALRAALASDLLVRSWTSQDTRQRSVLALLKTREGYIWLGTGKGLLRFDGVDFTSLRLKAHPECEVIASASARSGRTLKG